MSEWPMIRFGELAAQERGSFAIGPFGSRITKDNYVAFGVPVVRGVNLARGTFVDENFVYITEDKADELSSCLLVAGDLVFTHRGTIGQVSMVPRSPRFERYILSSSQVKSRLDQDRAIPEFYYYWFSSPDGQRALLANASTVGVPGIASPLSTIRDIWVPCPRIVVQQAIAELLGALDNKVAANDRVCETAFLLEVALFEESLHRDAISVCLGDVGVFHNRNRMPLSSRQRAEFSGSYPYYGANGVVDRVAGFKFDGDYVLVGEDGTVVTGEGSPVVGFVHGKFWVNNHAHVLSGSGISNELLMLALKRSDVRPYVTGAVQPKLSMGNLKRLPLKLPAASVRPALDRQVRELHCLMKFKREESISLVQLRNVLLPKLMSGEIRVRDAEREVENAL
jgi:type I restriction enzyme S subunit